MQPSQVHVWFMLTLPTVFTRTYLTNDVRVVTLQVSDGRTWQVHCAGRLRVRLCKGWKAFVLDNNLEENDICIFELVNKMELKVTIFRDHQDPTQRKSISTQPKSRRWCNLICRGRGYNGKERKSTHSKKNYIFEPVGEEKAYPMVDKNDDDALLDCNRPYSSIEPITSTTAIKVPTTWVDEECWNLSNSLDAEQGFDPCVHYRERPAELVAGREISYVSKDGCEIFGSIFKNAVEARSVLESNNPNNNEPTMYSPPTDTLVRPFNDNPHGMKNKRGPLELSSSMFGIDLQSNETKTKRSKLSDDETECNNQEPGRKESSILMQGQIKVVSAARRVMTPQGKDGSTVAARGFTSENPFCSVTMLRSYVSENYSLNIPKDFADNHLKDVFQGITLRLSNKGSWNARYQVGDHRKLCKGWKEFAIANHLQEKDVCIFELVDRNHIELQVFIIRVHSPQYVA